MVTETGRHVRGVRARVRLRPRRRGARASPRRRCAPWQAASPCPAAGCASGECHGFDAVPGPDGVHEMTVPGGVVRQRGVPRVGLAGDALPPGLRRQPERVGAHAGGAWWWGWSLVVQEGEVSAYGWEEPRRRCRGACGLRRGGEPGVHGHRAARVAGPGPCSWCSWCTRPCTSTGWPTPLRTAFAQAHAGRARATWCSTRLSLVALHGVHGVGPHGVGRRCCARSGCTPKGYYFWDPAARRVGQGAARAAGGARGRACEVDRGLVQEGEGRPPGRAGRGVSPPSAVRRRVSWPAGRCGHTEAATARF